MTGHYGPYPMNRDSSGTSWVPDTSPMHGFHLTQGPWMWMVHGNGFLRYVSARAGGEGDRGDAKVDSPNYFMAMGQRPLGPKWKMVLRAMLTLEPLTIGGAGTPLLFQTGETWRGRPLVDKQHPHELFSELSMAYAYSVSDEDTFFVYLAHPGEPALGPAAFMHRPSAEDNPDVPLGHHWQDSTHVAFGVATLGWRSRNVMFENSVFTGREPNENRYDFDKARFDSYSARLSFMATRDMTVQFSYGILKDPDALESGIDELRPTASLIYNKPQPEGGNWATTLVFGKNFHVARRHDDQNHAHEGETASILLESNYRIRQAGSIYGRWEYIQKFASSLQLPGIPPDDVVPVSALTLGGTRTIWRTPWLRTSLGLQGTLDFPGRDAQADYGKQPYMLQVFLRLVPGRPM